MRFSRKINLKITTIMMIFLIIFTIGDAILMNYSSEKSVKLICETQKKEVIENFNKEINILKSVTTTIATNKSIISILNASNNGEITDIQNNEVEEQISVFHGVISSLDYVDNIDIINLKGQYINNNNNKDKRNFAFLTNSNEKGIYSKKNTIVTNIHNNTINGDLSISIVTYAYEDEKNIGLVMIDINLQNLLQSIDNGFKLGELNSYIKLDNGAYFSKDGIESNLKENSIANKQVYYTFEEAGIGGNSNKIIFKFNEKSLGYKQAIKGIAMIKVLLMFICGLILTLIITKLIKRTTKPIIQSLDKFKGMLDALDKKDFNFEREDEFTQLEYISNALSKSFDNKIQSLIYYDELTKLPNKKMLAYICNELVKVDESFALIFLNIKKFKYVNDVFGHTAGDELLKKFSDRMQKIIGNKGIVTRYSGDEFIILYKDFCNDNQLVQYYNDVIVKEFKNPIYFNKSNKLILEFSAGVAVYPRDGQIVEELINKSDLMMHNSKDIFNKNRVNEILFFNDKVYEKIIKAEKLKEELKKAVDSNELILYYQPIVDRVGLIKKAEALIRWNSSVLGFVSPADFISYAEETGEIIKIGYWIVEEVCKNYHYFNSDNKNINISINVSPIQLMEVDFVKNVVAIINKYKVDYANLCFEITESVVLDENIIVYDNLYKLNKLGIKIALDDFGTGYSSFSYLKKFKLDILKLDKIFIDNGNEIDYKIVNSIKEIAQVLNMEIVVEGVETKEQYDLLNDIGCDFLQGYYFSKPIPLTELKKFVSSN